MKSRRLVALFITTLPIAACSTVDVIEPAQPVAASSCHVNVYQTRGQATKRGEIKELCIISGTSSGSFIHTFANAIAMHKDKACACGATNVYVESRSEGFLDVAKVTMVGFRFVNKSH